MRTRSGLLGGHSWHRLHFQLLLPPHVHRPSMWWFKFECHHDKKKHSVGSLALGATSEAALSADINGGEHCFTVRTGKQSLILSTPFQRELQRWMTAIAAATAGL